MLLGIICVHNWECETCPLYRVIGCPLFRGFQVIEVYEEIVGTFRIALYIVGVTVEGSMFHCTSLNHLTTWKPRESAYHTPQIRDFER